MREISYQARISAPPFTVTLLIGALGKTTLSPGGNYTSNAN